jgi:hypothetical protein
MMKFKSYLAVMVCLTALLTQPSCLRDSYSVKLSGPVTLDEKWVEFNPEPFLKPDKDWQEVGLELEQPYNLDFFDEGVGPNKGKGILMPDRDVINPEIEVVDQNGNAFKLVYTGAVRVGGDGKGGIITYANPYPVKFPRDREYKTVRIKSPRPIKCKAVYWLCQSAKDLH